MGANDTLTNLQESTLVAQLHTLEQLTRTESRIAGTRIAQARTDQIADELRRNRDDAGARAARIAATLRDLDAVPDLAGPVIGWTLALAKAAVEQTRPLDEALLGDLALEQHLRDRARYLRALAEHLDHPSVVALADDLVAAHTETVEWITGVLAQEAAGGPAALVPTPVQKVAGGVTRFVGIPARFTVEQVNRILDSVIRRGDAAQARVRATGAEVAARAEQVGEDVLDVAAAGRNATLARAEEVARERGADRTAAAAHEVRSELGVLSAAELPIPHYEETTATDSIAAIRALTSADDVRAVLTFEEAHKNRATVLAAGGDRLDELTSPTSA